MTASMRPRKTPAENAPPRAWSCRCRAASMRPRKTPAENLPGYSVYVPYHLASMRPRKTPAENSWPPPRSARRRPGFNEAAENTRGKR